jgi:hypothetical protein
MIVSADAAGAGCDAGLPAADARFGPELADAKEGRSWPPPKRAKPCVMIAASAIDQAIVLLPKRVETQVERRLRMPNLC